MTVARMTAPAPEPERTYQVQVRCIGVPESLKGVPLPIEIIAADGTATTVTPTLGEYVTQTVSVAAPGRYLVRAELPSGAWVTTKTTVPESGGVEASLDLGGDSGGNAGGEVGMPEVVRSASDSNHEVANFALLSRLPSRSDTLTTRRVMATTSASSGTLESFPDTSRPTVLSLEFGRFLGWEEKSSGEAGKTEALRLNRYASRTVMVAPNAVAADRRPAASTGSYQLQPGFLYATPFIGDAKERVLVLWPPDSNPERGGLMLIPDTDLTNNENPDAPPLLGMSNAGDPTAQALFAYLRGGTLDKARQTAEQIQKAEYWLMGKYQDPISATLGGYFLIRAERFERSAWLENLANDFPYLPDGAVQYGWYLLKAGRAGEAGSRFRQALSRGIPMYTEGARLLHDGLKFLHGLYPDDTEVAADYRRAFRLAAAANFDSEVTCLRLGRGLDIVFED